MYELVAECRRDVAHVHCLHQGDLIWQLNHMLDDYQPSELVQLWENEHGLLLGFSLVYPLFDMFDVQIHPAYRSRSLEQEILSWAENQLQRLNTNSELTLYTLVNEHDSQRIDLLEEHNFRRGDVWHYLERSLDDAISEPRLPEGFLIRSLLDISRLKRVPIS